jgi:hypothetical protein
MGAAANRLATKLRSGKLLLLGLMAAPLEIGTADTFRAQLYDVTTETLMPHLEENLRYTTTHERRCLAHLPLAAAFPILTHPALQGCGLKNETHKDGVVSYSLVCTGGHGTTGGAIWHIDESRIRGTLNVKLGGKNMTFSQRVTAVPYGACRA